MKNGWLTLVAIALWGTASASPAPSSLSLAEQARAQRGPTGAFLELGGDLEQGADLAQRALADARRARNPDRLREALLVVAEIAVARGMPKVAVARLQEFERHGPPSAGQRLRAVLVRKATLELESLMPDGMFAVRSQTELKPTALADIERLDRQFAEAVALAAPREAALARIEDLEWFAMNSSVFGRGFRGDTSPEAMRALFDAVAMTYQGRIAEIGDAAGPRGPAVGALVLGRLAGLMGLDERAMQLLAEAAGHFREAADPAGQASAWLMAADLVLAPVAGVEAFNVPATNRGMREYQREATGFAVASYWSPPTSDQAQAAASLLGRAEELFASCDARRGLGAVALRRGYLAIRSAAPEQAAQEYGRAARLYADAGDDRGAMAVTFHRLMAAVIHGRFAEADSLSRTHLSALKTAGLTGQIEGCAAILMHASRELRGLHGDLVGSLLALDLSATYARSLEAPFTETLLTQEMLQPLVELRLNHRVVELASFALSRLREVERRVSDDGDGRASGVPAFRIRLEQVRMLQASMYQQMAGALLFEPDRREEFRNAVEAMARLGAETPAMTAAGLLVAARQLEFDGAIVAGDVATAASLAKASGDPWMRALVHLTRRQYPEAVGILQGVVDQYRQMLRTDGIAGTPAEETLLSQWAASLWQVAEAALAGDMAEPARDALSEWERSPATWRERSRKPWDLEMRWGRVAELEGRPEEALQRYRTALGEATRFQETLATEEQRVGAAEEVRQPAAMLVAHLLGWDGPALATDRERLEEAFRTLEMIKGRVLLSELGGNASGALSSDEAAELLRLERVTSLARRDLLALGDAGDPSSPAVEKAQDALRRTHLELDLFRDRMAALHPRWSLASGAGRTAGLREAQELAGRLDATLLSFLVMRDFTYVWAIDRDAVEVQVLRVARDAIEKRVRQVRASLESPDWERGRPTAFPEDTAASLYDDLLGPVAPMLGRHARVYLIPDGILSNLPFQALVADRTPVSISYVLDKVAVAYAPSVTSLARLTETASNRPSAGTRLLAMGNPYLGETGLDVTMLRSRLGPLESMEQEVLDIGRLWNARRGDVLTGRAALEGTFKRMASTADTIHLSAHGRFEPVDARGSGIFLSGSAGDQEDGYLQAREIGAMDLNARLVVLAACVSGLGRVASGEGMIGLSRAFFVAGAPAVVGSQWPVDSEATRDLMVRFHRRLKEDMAPIDALRAASLELRKTNGRGRFSRAHPFFWAPFMLVGSGS